VLVCCLPIEIIIEASVLLLQIILGIKYQDSVVKHISCIVSKFGILRLVPVRGRDMIRLNSVAAPLLVSIGEVISLSCDTPVLDIIDNMGCSYHKFLAQNNATAISPLRLTLFLAESNPDQPHS